MSFLQRLMMATLIVVIGFFILAAIGVELRNR